MTRTLMDYELAPHIHRGQAIHGARHNKYAPFACNSPVYLMVERHPHEDRDIVYEKCQCGKVLTVWRVLPEPLVLHDADDDGA